MLSIHRIIVIRGNSCPKLAQYQQFRGAPLFRFHQYYLIGSPFFTLPPTLVSFVNLPRNFADNFNLCMAFAKWKTAVSQNIFSIMILFFRLQQRALHILRWITRTKHSVIKKNRSSSQHYVLRGTRHCFSEIMAAQKENDVLFSILLWFLFYCAKQFILLHSRYFWNVSTALDWMISFFW